jgi:hypothetical protein
MKNVRKSTKKRKKLSKRQRLVIELWPPLVLVVTILGTQVYLMAAFLFESPGWEFINPILIGLQSIYMLFASLGIVCMLIGWPYLMLTGQAKKRLYPMLIIGIALTIPFVRGIVTEIEYEYKVNAALDQFIQVNEELRKQNE